MGINTQIPHLVVTMITLVKERDYYKICDFDDDEDKVVNEIKLSPDELGEVMIQAGMILIQDLIGEVI